MAPVAPGAPEPIEVASRSAPSPGSPAVQNPDAATTAEDSDERVLTRKEQIWLFIEDNTIVNTFFLIVIVFSTVCFVLESEYRQQHLRIMWFWCADDPAAFGPPVSWHAVVADFRSCTLGLLPTCHVAGLRRLR